MNPGHALRSSRGRVLEAHALRAGIQREWGETDSSLRARAEWAAKRSLSPWLRKPPVRRRWWARLWLRLIGVPDEKTSARG